MRIWPILALLLLSAAVPPSSTDQRIEDLLAQAQFAEAEKLARQELEGRAPETEERARALELLARALLSQATQESETEKLLDEALAIERRVQGPQSPRTAAILLQRSILLRNRGDFAGARQIAEEVLQMQERALGREDRALIPTLRQLGNMCKELLDLSCAEEAFTREAALIERHEGKDHLDAAANAYSRGWLAIEQGDYEEADRLFRLSSATVERLQGPDAPRNAWALVGLGTALDFEGDAVQAISVHERASAIVERTLGPKHPMYASCLTNLGAALSRAHDLGRAEEVLRSALQATEASYGPEHEMTARTALTLADVLRQRGRREEATAQLARARAIFEKSGNAYLPIEARIKAAELVLDGGDREGALRDLQAARADLARVLPGHPDLMKLDAEIGQLLLARGDLPGAGAAFERVIAQARGLGREDAPDALAAAAGLARTRLRQGRPEEAFTLAAATERRSMERMRLLLAGLPEGPALEAASARATGLPVTTAVAVASPASRVREAWDFVVRSRAGVQDELAGRFAAARDGAPEAWRDFSKASRRLANLLVRDLGEHPPSATELERAQAARDAAETELSRASASFARRRAARDRGLAAVLAARPSTAAIVAYTTYLRPGARDLTGYAAFVVSSSRPQPALVDLGPAEDLERAIQRWRDAIAAGLGARNADQEPAYREAAAALRRLAWDPVQPLLGAAPEVAVVPDGPLNLVSFGALPTESAGYLVERFVFRYLSSERDLGEPMPAGGPNGLLAVGGPDFEGATRAAGNGYRGRPMRCVDFAGHHFEALDAAAEEAGDVVARWTSGGAGSRALLLQGAEATEARVKAEASRYTVLHLATHGFFLDPSCDAVTRGIGGLAPMGERLIEEERPLALSGLALAGANHRGSAGPNDEDGILTAEEVAALDLSHVRWVVLSGCDTGLGTIRSGEGVLGLQRAFRIAGAATVVMSLWPVKDASTRAWMEALYGAQGGHGADAAAAATEATRSYLARQRERGRSTHPADWGAFVVGGYGRSGR